MPDDDPLLTLQQVDSASTALHVRRAGLPERALLSACVTTLAALADDRAATSERRSNLEREERRVATRVTDVEAHAREVERHLYSGKVTAAKELAGIQAELNALKQRQREHEAEEYALLEQGEQIGDEVASLDARRAALDAEGDTLQATIAAAEAGIDAELEALTKARAEIVHRISAEVLATYEKLRAVTRYGGQVTARFDGKTCRGCDVGLPIMDITRIRSEPAGARIQCPHCMRLLIR